MLGADCFKNKTTDRSVFNKGLFDSLIYAASQVKCSSKNKTFIKNKTEYKKNMSNALNKNASKNQ